jgi:histidyl-tRNA synthetase
MSKPTKDARPTPRLPRGLRDIEAAELRQQQDMLAKIRAVYELYGFEPLETPAFEYTDALGKFLPDQDRPNAGVFSFQDSNEVRGKAEAEEWMSLRYDLTAPLARYVAQNYQDMPKPFRRYAVGPVWRNEKPGPGRFRQFMQFDADTVGAESVAADAEMCMLAADTLEALGIKRGDYVIKVGSRKLLDGAMEAIKLSGPENSAKRLIVLRALDKLDRLGLRGVRDLLGAGRKDESGDFTPGAGLDSQDIATLFNFVGGEADAWIAWHADQIPTDDEMCRKGREVFGDRKDGEAAWETDFSPDQDGLLSLWMGTLSNSDVGREGVMELRTMLDYFRACGYGTKRIQISSSVVRGLEYYTGPVLEAELTFEVKDEKGRPVRFGSVGGGGRYDDLVARFTGQKVPATGFSIGVSRLQAALASLGSAKTADGPVIVTVMEKERIADYQKMVQALRTAGIRAELYLGNPKKFGKQLEYADKRGSPCVVIQGSDERAKGEVTLKDLVEGAKAAAAISDNKEWKEQRPAQVSVKEADLVAEVRKILARHSG